MTKKERVLNLLKEGKTWRQIHAITGSSFSMISYYSVPGSKAKALKRNTKWIIKEKIKAGGKCIKCGYNRCLGALHFHHKDRTTKIATIGHLKRTKSVQSARDEMKKCLLICANCHAEAHAGLIEL